MVSHTQVEWRTEQIQNTTANKNSSSVTFLGLTTFGYVRVWCLIQVHYPPYLFEAFLFEPIDDVRSSAKVGNGVAVISLPKRSNKEWEQLMITTG